MPSENLIQRGKGLRGTAECNRNGRMLAKARCGVMATKIAQLQRFQVLQNGIFLIVGQFVRVKMSGGAFTKPASFEVASALSVGSPTIRRHFGKRLNP
jgi:hypothetical protein